MTTWVRGQDGLPRPAGEGSTAASSRPVGRDVVHARAWKELLGTATPTATFRRRPTPSEAGRAAARIASTISSPRGSITYALARSGKVTTACERAARRLAGQRHLGGPVRHCRSSSTAANATLRAPGNRQRPNASAQPDVLGGIGPGHSGSTRRSSRRLRVGHLGQRASQQPAGRPGLSERRCGAGEGARRAAASVASCASTRSTSSTPRTSTTRTARSATPRFGQITSVRTSANGCCGLDCGLCFRSVPDIGANRWPLAALLTKAARALSSAALDRLLRST